MPVGFGCHKAAWWSYTIYRPFDPMDEPLASKQQGPGAKEYCLDQVPGTPDKEENTAVCVCALEPSSAAAAA
jgi:hypothetical protein